MSELDLRVLNSEPIVYTNHNDWKVRLQAAEDMRWTPSAHMVSRGVSDGSMRVVAAWIRRKDIFIQDFTIESVVRKFNKNNLILNAIEDRKNYIYSPEELSFYFEKSEDFHLRCAISRLDYFKPTPEQIEMGLSAKGFGLRQIWASRKGYIPTEAQISRGLNDEVSEVSRMFLEREDISIPVGKIKEIIYTNNRRLLPAALLRPEYTATPEELKRVIEAPKSFVGLQETMKSVLKRDDLRLLESTYTYGLNHNSLEIRDLFKAKKVQQERIQLSEKFIDGDKNNVKSILQAL